MRYRLWDTDINRLFGTYDHEDEALALVRTLVDAYGEHATDDLALGCEYPDGSFAEPVSGAALLHLASPAAADRENAEEDRGEVIASRSRSPGRVRTRPMAAQGE